jgi:protein TonB
VSVPASSSATAVPHLVWQQLRRIGPLGLIILLHIGFFLALQSGLLRQATQALPKEVFATFVTPQSPKPEPPKPEPPKPAPAPKTVPIVKKPAVQPKPVATPVNPEPAERAITTPPVAPQSVEPPAPPAPAQPPAPPAPAAPAQPKTVSGVEYVQPPQPDYPPAAKRLGEEGKVMLRVLVNEKGRPERVEIQKSSGSARLDEAARQAVLRALFKPYIEDGKAFAVFAVIPIKFQLNN